VSARSAGARPAFDPELETLVSALRAHGVEDLELAFVLGSGLGAFAARLEEAHRIPFAELEGMPRGAVAGHLGELALGRIAGVRVLAQIGRAHLYEGWSARALARPVRAYAALGCRGVVLTNAAGGLRSGWPAGTLVQLADHVNLQGRTPLRRDEAGFDSPYDARLGLALETGAREAGARLERGVYAGLFGPSYETPAEVRLLARLGADVVGMSTVVEAVAARATGMRVAGLSLVANLAAGLSGRALAHEDVLAAGEEHSARLCDVLERAVPRLVEALASP